MSAAKLNIWLRYADCSVIDTCWRTDLAINTCCGESLYENDKTILEQLRKRYSDFHRVELNPNYNRADRMLLQPRPWHDKAYFHHIEVDVPPGCYVVWTRVCYRLNEETNKMMVVVRCGDEACVNLLLDKVETCAGNLFHPLFEGAIELDLPNRDLRGAARVLNALRGVKRKEFDREFKRRIEDAEDEKVRERIGRIEGVFARKGGAAAE